MQTLMRFGFAKLQTHHKKNWNSISDSGHFNSLEWKRPKMLGNNLLKYE